MSSNFRICFGGYMIQLKKGNIFDEIKNCDLIIIFGHLGLNQLKFYWEEFRNSNLNKLPNDPFQKGINKISFQDKQLWFVSGEVNHGLSDQSLNKLIEDAVHFAIKNSLSSIAFNGASNIDLGFDTAKNQKSDAERVSHIVSEFNNQFKLQLYTGDLILISMSDSFEKVSDHLIAN